MLLLLACGFAGLATIWIVARKPSYAMLVMYCMFAFEQWAQSHVTLLTVHSWIMNVFAGLIISAALLSSMMKQGVEQIRFAFGGKLLLLLLVYAFLSVGWAPNPAQGLDLWARHGPYLILAALVTPWLVTKTPELHVAYRKLAIMGAGISVLLLLSADWESRKIIVASDQGEAAGNPLEVATLAGTVLIVAAIMQAPLLKSSLSGFLRWATIFVAIAIIIRSGSRGQLISAAAVLVLLGPMRFTLKKFRNVLYLAFLSAGGALVGLYALNEFWYGSTRWTQERMGGDISGRVAQSMSLLEKWYSDPVTMTFGLGNSASYEEDILGYYAHNVPVEILAEEGLIGAFIFIWFLIWTAKKTRRLLKQLADGSPNKDVLLVSLGLFLYFLILTLKQGSLLGSHLFFMSAMILANCLDPRREPHIRHVRSYPAVFGSRKVTESSDRH